MRSLEAALEREQKKVALVQEVSRALSQTEDLDALLALIMAKVTELMEAARGWSDAELERAVAALSEADRRVKTGADARSALVAAVVEATGKRSAPGATGAPRPPR